MFDDEDFDAAELEEDFCEKAAKRADYEEAITNKIVEMRAAGEDMSDLVLGDYLFDARAKAKLARRGFNPNDVMDAINDPERNVERSNSTGQHIVSGRCRHGRIWVVYADTIGKETRERAPYTVITAFSR